MEKEIKKDIISVLTQSLFLIKKQDFIALKELSNHVIHDASIFQDQDSLQVAVVIYSLGKVLEKAEEEGTKISINVITTIEKALSFLTEDNEESYRTELKKLLQQISERDEEMYLHIQRVIEKANVVKSGKIYSHGISMGRAAEILGVNQWELMSFVGKTRIADKEEDIADINKRLNFAKKLFRVL